MAPQTRILPLAPGWKPMDRPAAPESYDQLLRRMLTLPDGRKLSQAACRRLARVAWGTMQDFFSCRKKSPSMSVGLRIADALQVHPRELFFKYLELKAAAYREGRVPWHAYRARTKSKMRKQLPHAVALHIISQTQKPTAKDLGLKPGSV